MHGSLGLKLITRANPTATPDNFLPSALADAAEKSRTLSLNDPFNRPFTAGRAKLARTVINPMLILVSTRLIQRISIRAVRKCRTLVTDSITQHFVHRRIDPFPFGNS